AAQARLPRADGGVAGRAVRTAVPRRRAGAECRRPGADRRHESAAALRGPRRRAGRLGPGAVVGVDAGALERARARAGKAGVSTGGGEVMTMVQAAEDRYTREREAHNKIFAEHTRASAERFYRIIHESRALYEGLIRSRSKGGSALEYGCGMGSHAHFMATNGAERVVGIDISDVAIQKAHVAPREAVLEKARVASRKEGIENVEYRRMNAEFLEFDDHSFDLICGTAILHHLDLARAYSELARVLKPGGLGVFMEPLGHNPLINMYRRMTPNLRTVDEHPLMMRDIKDAKTFFRRVTPQHFVLQSLAAVRFHGRKSFRKVLHTLEASDALMFRCLPFTKRYSWQGILSLGEALQHGRP